MGQTKAACRCTDEMKNGESDKWEKEWVWRISLVNKRKMKKTTSNWNAMAIGSNIYSFNRHRCDRSSSSNNNIQASIQVKLIGNNESITLWAVWKEHNSNHRPTTCVCATDVFAAILQATVQMVSRAISLGRCKFLCAVNVLILSSSQQPHCFYALKKLPD